MPLGALNRLLIVGMGRSGAAAARAARRMLPHAAVVLSDSREGVLSEDAAGELAALGITLAPGRQDEGLLAGMFPGNSLVVKSPGVPRSIPLIEAALRRAIPVWGEVEMARRFLPNPFVGVTGTNGKTTTTELIGHILRGAGRPCRVAGNVGTALSTLVGAAAPEEILVVELSSFQLEDSVELRPDIAVLLNLTEDHLDRHLDATDYFAAKKRIFANQQQGDVAVVNADDPRCRGPLPGSASVLWFSREDRGAPSPAVVFRERMIMADPGPIVAAATALRQRKPAIAAPAAAPEGEAGRTPTAGGEILIERKNREQRDGHMPVMAWSLASLKGMHNLDNALAATAVGLSLGLGLDEVAAGLKTFPGVRHRLQVVCEVAGVTYVNDSKATNVDAAAKALSAFTAPVHLILGGSLKGCSFAPLAAAIAGATVSEVLLIGEAARRIAADLNAAGLAYREAGDLEAAVRLARAGARAGDVVLLAPACASFDQYRSYEERGEHFISLVENL